MHFEEVGGAVEGVVLVLAALGLDLTKLGEGVFELAGEALAVDSEIGEGVDVFAEGESHGEGGFGLGVTGGDAGFVFGDAEREEVGLEGGDAIEAPGGVGERLNQLLFEGAGGLEVIEEAVGVALVSGVVLCGQNDGVAGEAMAEGVQLRALFAGVGAGAGGFLGIGLVDGGAVEGGGIGCAIVAVGAGVVISNVGHFGNLLDSEIACGAEREADGDWEVVEGMGKKFGRELVTQFVYYARIQQPDDILLTSSTPDERG